MIEYNKIVELYDPIAHIKFPKEEYYFKIDNNNIIYIYDKENDQCLSAIYNKNLMLTYSKEPPVKELDSIFSRKIKAISGRYIKNGLVGLHLSDQERIKSQLLKKNALKEHFYKFYFRF